MNANSTQDLAELQDLADVVDVAARIGQATTLPASEVVRRRLEVLDRLFGRLSGDQIDALPAGSVIVAGPDVFQSVDSIERKEYRWCRADRPASHNTYELMDRYDEVRLVITGPELDMLNS